MYGGGGEMEELGGREGGKKEKGVHERRLEVSHGVTSGQSAFLLSLHPQVVNIKST